MGGNVNCFTGHSFIDISRIGTDSLGVLPVNGGPLLESAYMFHTQTRNRFDVQGISQPCWMSLPCRDLLDHESRYQLPRKLLRFDKIKLCKFA